MIKKILRAGRALASYPYKRELLSGVHKNWFPVFIKYPVYPKPRYGYDGDKPNPFLYEMIDRGRLAYKAQLLALKAYDDRLLRIKTDQPEDGDEPYWSNPWFSGLDAIALYGLLAATKPKLYLEVGSGNSTKFARRAIRDHALGTTVISIDPFPRASIDGLSDEVVRKPLEDTDLGVFDRLGEGDILFIDSSHRSFMNSDVTVLFLEVLPKLPPGVLIHIHDIHLPDDYPPQRANKYESEQYLLAAMLLGGCSRYEIVLPIKFIIKDDDLCATMDRLWTSADPVIPKTGGSFWIRTK